MPAISTDLAEILVSERVRLIGLCTVLTGDPRVAEDLTQETLLEAWRLADRVYDPAGVGPWLSAIARHVCARWARRQGQEFVRSIGLAEQVDSVDAFAHLDLEADLERTELAQLLDRALALLPAETRAALVARYVEELPQTQVALRLGLSEGAVAMRIQRGKLALRRLLATDLREEAATYGLDRTTDDWIETQLWCPICGRQKLHGRLIRATGEFMLRCPQCTPTPEQPLSQAVMPLLHRRGQSPRAATARLQVWLQERYWTPEHGGLVRCVHCERLLEPVVEPNRGWPAATQLRHALVTHCSDCGTRNAMWLTSLAFGLPEGQAFWRTHPQLRLLPEHDLTWEGHLATLVGFESMTSTARLEVMVIHRTDGITALIPH